MSKKVVFYDGTQPPYVEVGSSAYVLPINHPGCSNKNVVKTSRVVSKDDETGRFETLNTIYERKVDAQ